MEQRLALLLCAASLVACSPVVAPDEEPVADRVAQGVSIELARLHGDAQRLQLTVAADWGDPFAQASLVIDGRRVAVLDRPMEETTIDLPGWASERFDVAVHVAGTSDRVTLSRGPDTLAWLALQEADPRGQMMGDGGSWSGYLPIDGSDDVDRATRFLRDYGPALGMTGALGDSWRPTRLIELRDEVVVEFSQYADRNIRVGGGRIGVRIADGVVRAVAANEIDVPANLGTPSLRLEDARRIAATRGRVFADPELLLQDGALRWAAIVETPDNPRAVFIDAGNASIVHDEPMELDAHLTVNDLFETVCNEDGCIAGTPAPLVTVRTAMMASWAFGEVMTGKPAWVGDDAFVMANDPTASSARYIVPFDIITIAPGMECSRVLGHEWHHALGRRLLGPTLITTPHEEGVADIVGMAVGSLLGLGGFNFGVDCGQNLGNFGAIQPTHICALDLVNDENGTTPVFQRTNFFDTAYRMMTAGGSTPLIGAGTACPTNADGTPAPPPGSNISITNTIDPVVAASYFFKAYVVAGRTAPLELFKNQVKIAAAEDGQTCTVRNALAAIGMDTADLNCDGVADSMEIDAPPFDDFDGVAQDVDNCPEAMNFDQEDLDGDGMGDACDLDDDGDGVGDTIDNCPEIVNADQSDIDGDGTGDACDEDDDGDGKVDGDDNCPDIANASQGDLDGDKIGDSCDPDLDGDGIDNVDDGCPFVHDDGTDSDGDGRGDECDNCDFDENFDQSDCDGDKIGDVCEPEPLDIDNDGVLDAGDNCPCEPNPNQLDQDGDGIGDKCDSVDPHTQLPFDEDGFWHNPEDPAFIPIPPCFTNDPLDPRAWWDATRGEYTGRLTVRTSEDLEVRLVGPHGVISRVATNGRDATFELPMQTQWLGQDTPVLTLEVDAAPGTRPRTRMAFTVERSCDST